jgi:hypothetical protein
MLLAVENFVEQKFENRPRFLHRVVWLSPARAALEVRATLIEVVITRFGAVT